MAAIIHNSIFFISLVIVAAKIQRKLKKKKLKIKNYIGGSKNI